MTEVYSAPATVNKEASAEAAGADAQGAAAEENGAPKLGEEYTRLFEVVRKNPVDFNSWTQLLKACDTESYDAITEAFDAFLAEYPFCYGYWKKYADHTYRSVGPTNPAPVLAIFERAVAAVRFSVDAWGHYCNFLATLPAGAMSPEAIRAVYNRAIEAVGSMPLANANKTNQLWNSVLRFELETTKDPKQIASVYHRLLRSPFNGVGAFLVRYDEWAKSPAANLDSPDGAVSDEELASLQRGLALPEDFAAKPRQEQIIHCVNAHHQRALAIEKARAPYEKALGFYFHVKPISEAEQTGWRSYLAFEQAQEKAAVPSEVAAAKQRTVTLFERCVIRCANYPEFWRAYADYKEASGASTEEVVATYRRCTEVHLKRLPGPRLTLADYLETKGLVDLARAEYAALTQLYPSLVQGALESSNFERRHGNIDAAAGALQSALAAQQAPTESESESESTSTVDAGAFLAVQLANFQLHIKKDVAAARTVYSDNLATYASSSDFIAAYVAFEMAHAGAACATGQGLDGLLASLVGPDSKVPTALKISLWRRRVELAEDLGQGYDIAALIALRKQRDTAIAGLESGDSGPSKRAAGENGGVQKKSRVEQPSTPAAGAAASAYAQQQAAYGHQQQDPQLAAQWAAYYAQQAAYQGGGAYPAQGYTGY